jgi:RNA polymerase sigma-70 factor (ECF subfamily)
MFRKTVRGLGQRQQLFILSAELRVQPVKLNAHVLTAPLQGILAADAFDQNAMHRFSGRGEKIAALAVSGSNSSSPRDNLKDAAHAKFAFGRHRMRVSSRTRGGGVSGPESVTNPSLLLRIRCSERREDAWREFVARYGSRIFAWCRHRQLSADDAEDVTQEVLVKLARYLESFEYDGTRSFRGWLRRVTENAVHDYFRERRKRPDAAAMVEMLDHAEARDDLSMRLRDAFDLELLELAMARVQKRVSSSRFDAWALAVRDGWSGADIAAHLGMKIASVYTAKSQIQSMLQEEIRVLERVADENLPSFRMLS